MSMEAIFAHGTLQAFTFSVCTKKRSTYLPDGCHAASLGETTELARPATATAHPTGTNRFNDASASSITRHMAISGAFCEAASRAHAPINAYTPIELVWKHVIHTIPSNAPIEAPNAMPGCNTPPEAPARMVSSVTTALAANESSNAPAAGHPRALEKLSCAVARPLPMTCGTQIATAPVSRPANGRVHSIAAPEG